MIAQKFAENNLPIQLELSLNFWPLVFLAGLLLSSTGIARGQRAVDSRSAESPMQEHYSSAFRFQSSGNLTEASSEYKLFLAMALHRIANGRANLGEYARAVPVYDEALRLEPVDRTLKMDYAVAALDASDWRKAKHLASAVLDSLKSSEQPPDPHAVSVLARALLEMGEHQEALMQFKAAVLLSPGFSSSSDLASAYLVLGDRLNAAKILDGMPDRFGDTATLHMKIGIMYGRTKFFDEATEEFRKAIAKDPQLKGAHYSTGASYMMQTGDGANSKAEEEFRREIALDPDNALVYAPLGRIAMSKHKYADAEADLKRAIELNPRNVETYIILGQLYVEIKRTSEAEAAFRKAIVLTLDPSANGYEVERAHFGLGRRLIQSGELSEGRKELDVSRDLLYLKEHLVQSRLSGNVDLQAPLERTREPKPGDLTAERAFEKQIAPLIASSYNNLGVNAARASDYSNASAHFGQAAQWDPTLKGVDNNWGYAAFDAREYGNAAGPLGRILAHQPEDAEVRAMLGLSYAMVRDYAQSLRVLRPIEASLQSNPQAEVAYFGSMAIAGDYERGIGQLQTLEQAHPEVSMIHCFIGEALASRGHNDQAAEQLHAALRLDPSSKHAKYALAVTDVALGEKGGAQRLFSELADAGSTEGDVYYRLGKLQIETESARAAIPALETAVRLEPANAAYHRGLAEAYRRNERLEEADREDKESDLLEVRSVTSLLQ
jgi:tetratricopeptide (TPR) repeat protein